VTSRFGYGAAFAMLCAIWGSTWLAIKIGLQGAPPFLAANLRFVVASGVLLALAAVRRSPLPRGRIEWGLAAFVGLLLFTFDYGLIYWGENSGVESGLSAILFATLPLQTAIAAHGLLRDERLTIQKVAGIAIGFGGILVIFRAQLGLAGAAKLLPMAAIVVSASCASVCTVAVKRWGHDTNPITFNGIAMGVGAVGLAAFSLAARETWAVPTWPEGIGAILYLALAGSVVTFVTYLWLLKRIQATVMSYIALVTPIVAVFLGVSLGSEGLDPIAVLGAALTLGGIYLSTSRRVTSWGRGLRKADVPPASREIGNPPVR
jgi:drug/metabolite transporter (DMT)-like permease